MGMISILIPVYNFDIASMVTGLQQAIIDSDHFDNIIIGADGCDDDFIEMYKALARLKKVKLLISKENIGRASIRNRLADEANAEHLLFLDADALIEGNPKDFLFKWYNSRELASIIFGGTGYHNTPPDDPDRNLRWRYSYNNERHPIKKRKKRPYSTFSSFNFVIEKSLMMKFRFNEELRKYGHEDTLFAYQLKKAGIEIAHIDNSVIHDGLETNREFILKTQESVENLSVLYDKVTDRKTYSHIVKLLRVYNILRIFGIARLLAILYKKHKRRIEIYLRSAKYSMGVFRIYKLCLFCNYRYN